MRYGVFSMMKLKLLAFATALNLGFASTAVGAELVNTPFGPFPAECVHEHPSGSTVEQTDAGLKATYPDGSEKIYPRKQVCLDALDAMNKRTQAAAQAPNKTAYASMMLSQQVTKFSSTYTIPTNPVNKDKWFAIWIGLQDPGQSNSVLQPVLVHNGPLQQWEAQSWHCCPQGEPNYSRAVTGMQSGDEVFGIVENTSPDAFSIATGWNGQRSVLKTKSQAGSVFNWALALLEPQTVKTCDDIPSGDITFGQIAMYTAGGAVTPSWSLSNSNSCVTNIDADATQVILKVPQ